MYQKKLKEDIRCPLEYGLSVFGGKWNSRIICVLAEMGTLRYSEIRSEMEKLLFRFYKASVSGQVFSIGKIRMRRWPTARNVIIIHS